MRSIDHVLVNKRRSSSMIDVKTCRGANCDSDHYLVRIKVRQKLSSSVKTKGSRRTKWDVGRLKDKEIVEKFQNKIANLLTETHSSEDVEGEWKNIKCAITGATSQIIKKKHFKRNEDWFDQECVDALNARNWLEEDYCSDIPGDAKRL